MRRSRKSAPRPWTRRRSRARWSRRDRASTIRSTASSASGGRTCSAPTLSSTTTRKFKLENGLAVTLVEYGTLPKVTLRLAVRSGNIDEKAGEVWLGDLMGDLLSQGTETKTAAQIAEAAARMGGSLDVNVGED